MIKKTCHAYKTLTASIRAGNLGKAGSKRRARAESKPIRFRPDAAQPFDDRCLSWQLGTRTVSIWTTCGRLRGIRFACSAAALETLAACRRGESGCGVVAHADRNASRNIAVRGRVAWDAGRESRAPALPVTGSGWTRQPASPPVMP